MSSFRVRALSPLDLMVGLLTVLAPLFMIFVGLDYHADRLVKHLWNLGHIGVYFVWTWYLTYRWNCLMQVRPLFRLLAFLGLAIGTGLVIEGLQQRTGRTADIWDIARNMLGCFLALWWTVPSSRALNPKSLQRGRWLSVLLILLALYPLGNVLADRFIAWQQLPMLADFETPIELLRWSGGARFARSSEVSLSGQKSLKIWLGTTTYSGVSFHSFPQDWRRYDGLEIGIYNPDGAIIHLTCRIHDLHHARGLQRFEDRFNRRYALKQGWNSIWISLQDVQQAPQGRLMEMNKVVSIGLFATRLDHPRTVYLDRIRLHDRPPGQGMQ